MVASLRKITLNTFPDQVEKLTWFRFGDLGSNIILTTDAGDWHLVEPEVFSEFLTGALAEESQNYTALLRKGFIRNGFDVELQGGLIRRTKRFLYSGVHHHRIHLSSHQGSLPIENAKAIIDHVFTSQAERLTITLVQGPEPLDANLVSFIQEFAEEKNRYERRAIQYQLYGSMNGLDETWSSTLIEKGFDLHFFFDGDEKTHDAQKEVHGGASHEKTQTRIIQLQDAHPNKCSIVAEVHVGRNAKGHIHQVLQGLRKANIQTFRITPILEGAQAISPTDFGDFIAEIMVCLDTQDEDGTALHEAQVDALSARIQSGEITEPLMCTPPSTGYNARSYDPKGNIFPSCSALELHEQGDSTFMLGNVSTDSMEELSNHPTLRTLVLASVMDCLPGYQHLWSTPFIGVDPIAAYRSTGNIFTTTTTSVYHQATQAMAEAIFLHLTQKVSEAEE